MYLENEATQPIDDIILELTEQELWRGSLKPTEEKHLTVENNWYGGFVLSAKVESQPILAKANEDSSKTDAIIVFTFTDTGISTKEKSIEMTRRRELMEDSSWKFLACPT